MVSIVKFSKLTGRSAAVAFPGAASPFFPRLHAFTGMETGGFGGVSGFLGEGQRLAPAARASYAFAADDAGSSRLVWAGGTAPVTNEHHRIMRAFRGLEPWRDPS